MRLVKGSAQAHWREATFMAKPFADQAGSGMHIHVSVDDAAGANIFARDDPEGTPALRHAIGGMIGSVGDGFALFAPHANRSEERRVGKECCQYVYISGGAVSLKTKERQ